MHLNHAWSAAAGAHLSGHSCVIWPNDDQGWCNGGTLGLNVDSGGSNVKALRLNVDTLRRSQMIEHGRNNKSRPRVSTVHSCIRTDHPSAAPQADTIVMSGQQDTRRDRGNKTIAPKSHSRVSSYAAHTLGIRPAHAHKACESACRTRCGNCSAAVAPHKLQNSHIILVLNCLDGRRA